LFDYLFAIEIITTLPPSSFESRSFLPSDYSTIEPIGTSLSSVTSFKDVSFSFTKTHLLL
jgi:hypothetical protein